VKGLIRSLALLVSDSAGGLASRLAGGLALSAAALYAARLESRLIDGFYMLQAKHLFLSLY